MTDFQEATNWLRDAMAQQLKEGKLDATPYLTHFQINLPKHSDWKCYLFGNRPGENGIVYVPQEGRVPNRFVRWMMRVCFDCLWVKDEK